ncbi:hypothetical protein V8C35DRAFT_98140 [Trichoderma chlorosporum]
MLIQLASKKKKRAANKRTKLAASLLALFFLSFFLFYSFFRVSSSKILEFPPFARSPITRCNSPPSRFFSNKQQ